MSLLDVHALGGLRDDAGRGRGTAGRAHAAAGDHGADQPRRGGPRPARPVAAESRASRSAPRAPGPGRGTGRRRGVAARGGTDPRGLRARLPDRDAGDPPGRSASSAIRPAPATPAAALRAGASYLVVGRPITEAADPAAAARAILAEMETRLAGFDVSVAAGVRSTCENEIQFHNGGDPAGGSCPAWLLARAADAPRPVAPDGGDAQRLALLLDYVGGDYGRAVKDGVDPVAGRVRRAAALRDRRVGARRAAWSGRAGAHGSVWSAAGGAGQAASRKRPMPRPWARPATPHATRWSSRFGLRTMPTSRPQLARAEALYARTAPSATAPTDARRPSAPRRSTRARRASAILPGSTLLSPFRVYNALTFGVPGTGDGVVRQLLPD